jgi:16S rRNA (cytidine1402-2'-O)-methyltransferase
MARLTAADCGLSEVCPAKAALAAALISLADSKTRIIVVKRRGRLQVIATPIGNIGDLSARARDALESADLIAAEDTRHTLTLLQMLGISRPMLSLHAHNESQRVPDLLARLEAGETIALVSDAGTPLLSDPGFELVSQAATAGFEVLAIPGPSAITTALAVAGLPTSRFCFEGFLAPRERERRTQLAKLTHETRTLVFFEAPHRIAETLTDMADEFGGDRQAVVARELTKAHETIYRGTLAELTAHAQGDANFQRGEITIVVHGAAPTTTTADPELLRRAVDLLSKELPPSRVAAIAAQLTGATRNEAYALATRGTGEGREREPRDDDGRTQD